MNLTRGNLNFHSQTVNISFDVTHRFDDVSPASAGHTLRRCLWYFLKSSFLSFEDFSSLIKQDLSNSKDCEYLV